MLRSVVIVSVSSAVLLSLAGVARAEPAAACAEVREHVHDTVIVFKPPSTFTVCKDGAAQDGVVTERNVYLQLAVPAGPRMFDFRVHGKASDWSPMGLGAWESLTTRISGKLRELDHSGQAIADVSIPLEPPPATTAPLRPLAAARTRYLADVTPQFLESLHAVYAESRELSVAAGVVRDWCSALAAQAPGTVAAEAQLRATCSAPELHEGAVEAVQKEFEAAVQKGSADRAHAREATLAAIAHPEDGKVVADGVRALDEARASAATVVAAAHKLRESSQALGRAIGTLRVSLRSLDALRPGVPTFLARYSNAGNAELEIDAVPSDITAPGADLSHSPAGKAALRYPIFGRHYLDIEAGIGWAGGTPDSVYLTTSRGANIIQAQPVNEIVGLALVELEPLRFAWPERPLAGLLRFPVIAIPFTRDPTANFYTGAGIGWTGIGSITAGPFLLRETMLRQGFTPYSTLPPNVPFSAATYGGVGVGYYASASIDLVGLFHLFFPWHAPTLDGATGKEK